MNESNLYKQVSKYMNANHPGVAWRQTPLGIWIDQAVHADFGHGIKLDFKGLIVTVKRAGARLTKPDGTYWTPQIANEAAFHDSFIKQGFVCQFARGKEELYQLIDSYLEGAA